LESFRTDVSKGWDRLDALPAVKFFPIGAENCASIENKKADVVQLPKAFNHVGLLFSEPPGRAKLFFV
jgi:hypothetical protein